MSSRPFYLIRPVAPVTNPRGFWVTVCARGVGVTCAGLSTANARQRSA